MIMPTTPPKIILRDTFLMACSARMTKRAINSPKNILSVRAEIRIVKNIKKNTDRTSTIRTPLLTIQYQFTSFLSWCPFFKYLSDKQWDCPEKSTIKLIDNFPGMHCNVNNRCRSLSILVSHNDLQWIISLTNKFLLYPHFLVHQKKILIGLQD